LRAEGHELAFIAGPNERAETVAIRDAIDAHAPLIEGALAEVAREISAMSAVIAADNGIAHLAAAMRVPTVVLFGITDPALCAPWGKDVHVVHPSACPPCFRFGDKRFACKRHINVRCLREDLKVDHVLAALRATVPSHAPSRGPIPNGAQL
jgi:ADP-heptose:LPS heptosyltransferase